MVVAEVPSVEGMLHDSWDSMARLRRTIGPTTRIAVVGSSGNLLHRSRGAEIDAHDVVIRMNDVSVAGFEEDVGSRTDIRVAWSDGLSFARHAGVIGPHELLIYNQVTCGGSNDGDLPDTSENREADMLVLSRDWTCALVQSPLHSVWQIPSTGFQALAMAVAMAQSVGAPPVDTYGFGACPACGKFYHCNHGNNDGTSTTEAHATNNGYHPFGKEHEVRSAWHGAGIIRNFEPSCDGFPNYVFPSPAPPSPLPPAPPVPPVPSTPPPVSPSPRAPAPSPPPPVEPPRSPPQPPPRPPPGPPPPLAPPPSPLSPSPGLPPPPCAPPPRPPPEQPPGWPPLPPQYAPLLPELMSTVVSVAEVTVAVEMLVLFPLAAVLYLVCFRTRGRRPRASLLLLQRDESLSTTAGFNAPSASPPLKSSSRSRAMWQQLTQQPKHSSAIPARVKPRSQRSRTRKASCIQLTRAEPSAQRLTSESHHDDDVLSDGDGGYLTV